MKRLVLLFALLFAGQALAVDNPGACTGNNCKSQLTPRTSSGTATPTVTADASSGNGNVGIGTTSPGAALHISRVSGSDQIKLSRTSTSAGDVFLGSSLGDFRVGTSAGDASLMQVTTSSATFGPSASANTDENFTIDAAGTTGRPIVKFLVGASQKAFLGVSAGSSGHVIATDSTNDFVIGNNNTGRLVFTADASAVQGSMTAGGIWTLGPSSGSTTLSHQIQNTTTTSGNSTLQVQNLDTTSSSDASPGISIVKGSTTTTSSNIFIRLFTAGGVTNMGAIAGNGAGNAAFISTSDRRLKEHIAPITGSLAKIMALRPVSFDYKSGGHNEGFIAQDMRRVFPKDVSDRGDGMLQITGWDHQMAHLVEAIQELKAENDALKQRLEAAGL